MLRCGYKARRLADALPVAQSRASPKTPLLPSAPLPILKPLVLLFVRNVQVFSLYFVFNSSKAVAEFSAAPWGCLGHSSRPVRCVREGGQSTRAQPLLCSCLAVLFFDGARCTPGLIVFLGVESFHQRVKSATGEQHSQQPQKE